MLINFSCMKGNSIIIPIASGKGGVGKSIVTANLAIALAEAGNSVVAIDLDLGGSNLHTLLELENIYAGIADFVNIKKSNSLSDYLVKTSYPHLHFLPGDSRMAFMANLPHTQKTKLIKGIKSLDADFILLDLGAGTTFNTLDFYGLSHHGIVVTTFEKPSIFNTLSFMKNFLFRLILKEVKSDKSVMNLLNAAYKASTADDPLVIQSIINLIREKNPTLADKVSHQCKAFHPRIIFNKGKGADDLNLLPSLNTAIMNTLSLDVCYFGFVFEDDSVEASIKANKPLMRYNPNGLASKSIKSIAQRIIKHKESFIPDTIHLLKEDTQAKVEAWK